MSITRIGEFQAKPQTTDSLHDFLLSIMPLIKSSKGCKSVTLYQSHDDPTKFTMIEVWDSIESHQASVKNIPPEMLTEIRPLLASAPSGGYYDLHESLSDKNTTKDENILFGNISSIYHEMRQSFYYFFSTYSFLEGKVPDKANILLDEIGKICKELHSDIDTFPIDFDNHSANVAAEQIRSYATKRKKENDQLSHLINEILNLNIQMEDNSLDKFLNETLSHSFQKYSIIMNDLITIQPNDLMREI